MSAPEGAARSTILSSTAGLVIALALVFSTFLLFAGHNAPGGGFVGGLVAGAAVVVAYLDAGTTAVRRLVRVDPLALVAAGGGLAVCTGFLGYAEGAFLDAGVLKADLGPLGHLKVTGALPFDVGVFLVVVGLVAAALAALGDDTAARGSGTAPDGEEGVG